MRRHEMNLQVSVEEVGTTDEMGALWSDGHVVLDYELLNDLLAVPLLEGRSPRTGTFAKALDAWVAHCFKRMGFESDAIWPHLSSPRVIPPNLARGARSVRDRGLRDRILKAGGRSEDAIVLGSAYKKQVDVGMATWPTGPELLISTKTMSGSFDKNLANRFEEAYGDIMNLRIRHPLAAHGYVFLANMAVAQDDASFGRLVERLRTLRTTTGGYDETALLLYDATDHALAQKRVITEKSHRLVPTDLTMQRLVEGLTGLMLQRAPSEWHPEARRRFELRGSAPELGREGRPTP